jgi:hypothetical protein
MLSAIHRNPFPKFIHRNFHGFQIGFNVSEGNFFFGTTKNDGSMAAGTFPFIVFGCPSKYAILGF